MDCRQGCCTFEPDEAGRVLDRLAGLEKVIRTEDVKQALSQANRSNPRGCRLTHEVMLWVVLTMGLFTEVPMHPFIHLLRKNQLDAVLAIVRIP